MSIVVIGDIMIDINYHSEVKRNAPEANIPIYNVLDVNYILGGAANVANNLKELNTNIELLSIIGNDYYGQKITSLLESKNINNKIFIDEKRKTTQKHRIFLDNTLKVRYDIEDNHELSIELSDEIFDYIVSLNNLHSIVISDYDKGIISEYLSQKIIKYANENNILTFVDPKIRNFNKYKNCFLFKPNQSEAEIITEEKNIETILKKIKNIINCKNILLTRGKEGMILNNIYNKFEHENIINLRDVTGAGDIVMSLIVYCYLKYSDLNLACKISNYIAGKSVGFIGNYETKLQDIEDFFENKINNDFIKNKIYFDYQINDIKNISKNNNIVFTNGCFDILHSAHIELLKFAKSKGDILVVGLNSDDSIKRIKGQDRPINDINERSKILSLFDFIDYIIIFSDDTPFEIIKLLKPSTIIKGGDYNIENVVGKEYTKEVLLFNYIENKSSTNIIKKIKNI
jgi:D-beta-D-heptose 7-phosphate kinase/D-beta-D-heptose 1-phosphate adenosyltransferase